MSKDDVDKWASEAQNTDVDLSRSCSCFEILDPHDPVISRLATQLFQKTNDYLQGEIIAGQDYYALLEQVNRLAITKHADIRSLAINLSKTLGEYNIMYDDHIKPLLLLIDVIDTKVSLLEESVYRLDTRTKLLKAKFKELREK